MAIEREGLKIVKYYEGLRLNPYLCAAGVATIGYGATRYFGCQKVRLNDCGITEGDALSLLSYDYTMRERWVDSFCRVPLSSDQLGALTSFVFNVGKGNAANSTLFLKLNKGDYMGAANEFWKWRRANGVILRGLVARREKEKQLFVRGSI